MLTEEYGYLQNGDHATSVVNRTTQKIGDNTIRTRYSYDKRGNITEIRDGFNRVKSSYEYDELSRLVKENDIEFGYDTCGNILYRRDVESGEIVAYEYDGDRLMSFGGKKFAYDPLGNPTLYKDKPMTWDFRNLESYKGVKFKYNAQGLRKSKTCGNVQTEYFWAGDKLIGESRKKTIFDTEYLYERAEHYIYADYTHKSGFHKLEGSLCLIFDTLLHGQKKEKVFRFV